MAAHGLSPVTEAVTFLERGDLAGAERAALAVLANENDPDALHVMGLVRRKQKLHTDALDFFNRALTLRPGDPQILANLGRTLKSLGRNSEAVLALQAALAAQPDLADALCELGELQYRAGEGCSATEALRGLLYHRYVVDDRGLIVQAKIVPPTSQNQGQIEDDLRARGYGRSRHVDPGASAR